MEKKDWLEDTTPPPFFACGGHVGVENRAAPRNRKPARTITVLLIEDDLSDQRLIREFLEDSQGVPIQLDCASRLAAGLERMAQGGLDVILLDLTLPECRGLETFRRVHAVAHRVPIVVLTGIDDAQLALNAVHEGAEDYLVKAQVDSRLLVRSLHYAIERTRRRNAERALRAIELEFRIAREIQQRLFPAHSPSLPGFDISGASYPAEATGGDYFDYVPMIDGSMGIVVGDVSGHGFGPALLMADTRAYLRALAQTHTNVGSILSLANRLLNDDIGEDRFVTLVLARLDARSRSFSYSSAGHPTGYVLDRHGAIKESLPSTGPPLGIGFQVEYTAGPTIPIEHGDLVIFLTDGVLETTNRKDVAFGIDRALEEVRSHRDGTAQQIVHSLHRAVREFCGFETHSDDITAVVLKAD